jgi:hypothetical protein
LLSFAKLLLNCANLQFSRSNGGTYLEGVVL